MSGDACRATLTELLRLYDWRNELGQIERDPNHDKKQMKASLNKYGREKKLAWAAAREALGKPSEDRSCTCHPDDNPPVPCPQKFALTGCQTAVATDGLTNYIMHGCTETECRLCQTPPEMRHWYAEYRHTGIPSFPYPEVVVHKGSSVGASGLDHEFKQKVAEAVARYESLSPVDKALHDSEQRRSWVRGETGRDPGDVLADEVRRLRASAPAISPAICYTPCKAHEGMTFKVTLTAWSVPAVQVCPICDPPKGAA
jgi:hypothetical protein